MDCPYCSADATRVVDTRETGDNEVRRRRECDDCEERFTTYERVASPSMKVKKSDGSREPFDRQKVRDGIERACNKRPVSDEKIEDIVDQVESRVRASGSPEISSEEVGEIISERLRETDEVAYIRFASVYRSFEDADSFKEELEELEG